MVQYCGLDAEKYLEEMEKNEEGVRSCYDRDLPEWSSEQFQRMPLLDSSFILFMMDGFRTRRLEPDDHYVEYMALHLDVREHSEQIKLDLLTVDNQIPFFTIRILLGCFSQGSTISEESIEELALSCFDDLWPMKNEEQDLGEKRKEEQGRTRSVPPSAPPFSLVSNTEGRKDIYQMDDEDRGSRNALVQWIPSATELQKYATKFKKKHSGSCLDITFNRGLTNISGVINIPTLRLSDYSKPIFRNLIAFEATPTNSIYFAFTAYTACMSCILQREDDVKLLRESGIVPSTNYKDADIVKFFEELNKEIEGIEMRMTLLELYTNVTDHHKSRTSQWYGNFPWIKVALAGSHLLFLLTFLQTVYSILSYHYPKNK
uniref:Uncharacterized protein n=1 Tax=Ananas comosus var. bracteatus TaxID=296719 RepID=A0A6V7PLK2_ANACO|nr:unnamed protein product [Ananas comosus var. bracteatus]